MLDAVTRSAASLALSTWDHTINNVDIRSSSDIFRLGRMVMVIDCRSRSSVIRSLPRSLQHRVVSLATALQCRSPRYSSQVSSSTPS